MITFSDHSPAPVPRWAERVFGNRDQRRAMKLALIRIVIVLNLVLALYYITYRYTSTFNWAFWPLAALLLMAETYSIIETFLFSATMWRLKQRDEPPLPTGEETTDIFICCYNEPVELVRLTVRGATSVRGTQTTWLLDDGNKPEMRQMAEEEGIGYIVRSDAWRNRSRHAKAGNLNNALFQTTGEFILVLDADQVPLPNILERTLGYFRDPKCFLVQTPQWFRNVPPGDPYGSESPIFYGPILQGKDGWNAAFFCGTNAVLRREALMHGGIVNYASELEKRIRLSLRSADRVLRQAGTRMREDERERFMPVFRDLRRAIRDAATDLRDQKPLQDITWTFQRNVETAVQQVVAADIAAIRDELADLPGLDPEFDLQVQFSALLDDPEALHDLTMRETSPLAAIETIRSLIMAIDVDRNDEAMPFSPLSTHSVTEDIATAMRLHGLGWTSVYTNEVLAEGLAPEDLHTAFSQRLRWAQGNLQVMFQENPFRMPGLTLAQRLMYLTTVWIYLSGFFSVIYILAPVTYLLFGWMPVEAYSDEFFGHLLPYLLINQILFQIVGFGLGKWRGAQYSLALFPLWIIAVVSAIRSVYFGGKLSFVVTSKTRQSGAAYRIIRVQLFFMALLVISCIYGLSKIVVGDVNTEEARSIIVNVIWAIYDLVGLSILLIAATYRMPATSKDEETDITEGAATMHGRTAGLA